jgi:hypothetical protein
MALPLDDNTEYVRGYRQSRNNYKEFVELLSKNDKSQLSTEARRKLDNISSWWKNDAIRGLMNDIKYDSKQSPDRENLNKFLRKLRELRITNLKQLMDYIETKYKTER